MSLDDHDTCASTQVAITKGELFDCFSMEDVDRLLETKWGQAKLSLSALFISGYVHYVEALREGKI